MCILIWFKYIVRLNFFVYEWKIGEKDNRKLVLSGEEYL